MDNFAKEIENLIISNIPKQLSASVIMNNEGQRIDQSINSVNQCLLQILSKLQNIERDLFIIKRKVDKEYNKNIYTGGKLWEE